MRSFQTQTPVIMLHSCANTPRQWTKLATQLDGSFTPICPDLLGYGAPTQTGARSLSDIAQDVLQTAEIFDEPAHLIGHSFGGAVALKLASLRPDRIKSLTLIEPVALNLLWCKYGPDMPELRDIMAVKREIDAAEVKRDPWNAMRSFVDFWNGPGAWDGLSFEQSQKLASKAHHVKSDFDALAGDVFGTTDLTRITCPVLNLRGDLSPSLTNTITSELARALPAMEQGIVAGAGHMLPITHAERVNAEIGTFLANVESKCQTDAELLPVAA